MLRYCNLLSGIEVEHKGSGHKEELPSFCKITTINFETGKPFNKKPGHDTTSSINRL